ncbi:MAG: YfhO family protein [Anaerolineae bacterium]
MDLPSTCLLALAGLWLVAYLGLRYLYQRGWLSDDYHRDALALGAIVLATVGFFWQLLFTPNTYMPAGGGDLASFLYPVYHYAARSLKQGVIPLWNPYLYGGAPFVGDIQSGLFYPVNLLVFFLVPELTYPIMELLAVLHFFLAGAFTYLCLRYLERRVRMSRLAALGGGVAFMFSDLFITHFGNLNMIAVAAWLPLIFLFYHRAMLERRLSWAAWAGLFFGIATLAGHIQITLFIALALALYTAYQIVTAPSPISNLQSPISNLVLTIAVALGVSALVLLPSYEMAGHTLRAALDYGQASMYSLAPGQLIGLLVPNFFGRDPSHHWSPWERVEVGYIGILPLVLALLAVLLRREKLVRFLLGLAVVSLLLSLGGYSILHGWLYRWVPGFQGLRAPARFVYLMDFALAMLAALGLDALLRPLKPGQRVIYRRLLKMAPWVVVGTALLAAPFGYFAILDAQSKDTIVFWRVSMAVDSVALFLLFLAASLALLWMRGCRWVRKHSLGLLAIGLIAVDLASTGAYVDLGHQDPTIGFHHPAAVEFLKADSDYYRIDTRTDVWELWQPDLSLLHRVHDVWGVVNPLTLADYNRYWEHMGSRSSPLYDFLNAKYVVGSKGVALDWEKYVPVYEGAPQVNIYLNTRAFPRAFLVHQALIAGDHEEAFGLVHQPDFDPATVVVLESAGGEVLPTDEAETVNIVSYQPNEILLDVTVATPGYLVLSEVYYPGWRAYVDGHKEVIWRANYTFRAIYLEPGSHRVRFLFTPLAWRVGLGISLVTWLGLIIWSLLSARRSAPK